MMYVSERTGEQITRTDNITITDDIGNRVVPVAALFL